MRGNLVYSNFRVRVNIAVGLQIGKLLPFPSLSPARDADGGFGEFCRFLGMVSTFLYSILTKRAFSVSWQQPAPFDTLFDSPHIDWSRPFSNTTKTLPQRIYQNETLVRGRKEINAHNWEEEKIDEFFPGFIGNYSNGGNTSWLQVSGGHAGHYSRAKLTEYFGASSTHSSNSIEELSFDHSPTNLSLPHFNLSDSNSQPPTPVCSIT